MNETWWAHSEKDKISAQAYGDHVRGVYQRAEHNLDRVRRFIDPSLYPLLRYIVLTAAVYHDMGKLCHNCQKILAPGSQPFYGKMPNHVDAGVAYLLSSKEKCDRLAAWVVHAHHRGYCNYDTTRDASSFRDDKLLAERCDWVVERDMLMCEYTDKYLPAILERHNSCVDVELLKPVKFKSVDSLLMRLALGCLVEADHHDTAKNYKNFVPEKEISLRPAERLKQLDEYVASLQQNGQQTERNAIKQEVYDACRNSEVFAPVVCCPSEVGTGKTTAAMGYALRIAEKFGLEKVIYVAPYTNIISQTVTAYRNALVLPGENPKLSVGEHHHQVDYHKKRKTEEDNNVDDGYDVVAKLMTTTWNSAIVCTTAVQMFETLAARRCGRLKKFPQLVGSVILIDESHNCIPAVLWPATLRWVKVLVEKMGCRVVFCSGTLTKPWEIETFRDLSGFDLDVPSILPDELSKKTLEREKNRVPLLYNSIPYEIDGFCDWITSFDGSRVVVCNTINNAAHIAAELDARLGRGDFGERRVEHLSTCLTPNDREVILDRVKKRLTYTDDHFILVATSCVEAGVDFSFQYGFRENAGLLSALQFSGRINRENDKVGSEVHVFELDAGFNGKLFTINPDVSEAARIFKDFYAVGKIGPENCHEAMEREVNRGGSLTIKSADGTLLTLDGLKDADTNNHMKTVADFYRVISSNKKTVIIGKWLDDMLADEKFINKTDVVRNSVQMYENRINDWGVWLSNNLIEVSKDLENFYVWRGSYDKDFLGYMSQFV